jgi:hypothetical protein
LAAGLIGFWDDLVGLRDALTGLTALADARLDDLTVRFLVLVNFAIFLPPDAPSVAILPSNVNPQHVEPVTVATVLHSKGGVSGNQPCIQLTQKSAFSILDCIQWT